MKAILKTDLGRFGDDPEQLVQAKREIDSLYGIDVVFISKDEELEFEECTSKEAEIKMHMAKDMVCSLLTNDDSAEYIMNKGLDKVVSTVCNLSEQIFNRFHKGDE
jgi:hypothetical protein